MSYMGEETIITHNNLQDVSKPSICCFCLVFPRDAQNRNKIKLFERALLLFQDAINGF